MAPSPENDSAPKAPDKPRHDKYLTSKERNKEDRERNKDDKGLSDLNDGELKGLLDEALNYKNPKDREGKSKLFNHLLNEAEEDERNARAARAGGSELVRYCNTSAKRNSRHRKKPSSISENVMHGGSLDNLAKEELYETSKHRTKKSVSARQREGGSLPCNVNASTSLVSQEYQFLLEARKKKEMTEKKTPDVEEQRLLEHDSLDQSFQEKANELPHNPIKYTTSASLQVNVSEYGDIDRNRTVEKKGLQPNVPVFHVFMSRGGPDYEVDGPIQIPHLEQAVNRKNCAPSKSMAQVFGADCSGTIRISNDTKKVDENGNALHQNVVKTKKKKCPTDKNVVVCNAENVEGHRSDIISDIDKLMEFIGITEEQSEKNRVKSKQLNRHSSDDTSKSKKRAHSSKSKDNRSKLKKSNSLGEISTTNLDDFEFKDKVVMRNNKNIVDKPRERRSWGTMEPLPLQNLYSNASAENLETAEFRVVTKKKKSKKRRNSISGRTKSSSNPIGKNNPSENSPEPRRKSACSVPHSEKSNDSSDVDSVHSLPIDTQIRLNMPISYADMAKNSDKQPKEKKANEKVPKETNEIVGKCVTNQIVCDYLKTTNNVVVVNNNNTSPSAKNNNNNNSPPDVHNIKNFPAITKQVAVQVNVNVVNVDKTKNSNKVKANTNKNVKNSVVNKTVCVAEHLNNVQNDFMVSPSTHETSSTEINYSSTLPPDIPDVQTIEKMQLINQGHPSNCYDSTTITSLFNNGNDCSVDCDNVVTNSNNIERTTSNNNNNNNSNNNNNNNNNVERPPVVILSGFGNSKEVPGLVFGFDINEQLLSEDCGNSTDFCCEDFISRYVAPDVYTTTSHNHDKIVSYIGAAWEDALVNVSNGKVQYYSDLL